MRKILTSFMGVPLTLLVVAALAAGGLFAFLAWRDREAISFASSVVSENSPIAELATRKIVWKVTHVGSTTSVDTIRETVYTIKVGYDLAQAEAPVVDKEAKTVTLTLPPPKIISIDHFLQRESFEPRRRTRRPRRHCAARRRLREVRPPLGSELARVSSRTDRKPTPRRMWLRTRSSSRARHPREGHVQCIF